MILNEKILFLFIYLKNVQHTIRFVLKNLVCVALTQAKTQMSNTLHTDLTDRQQNKNEYIKLHETKTWKHFKRTFFHVCFGSHHPAVTVSHSLWPVAPGTYLQPAVLSTIDPPAPFNAVLLETCERWKQSAAADVFTWKHKLSAAQWNFFNSVKCHATPSSHRTAADQERTPVAPWSIACRFIVVFFFFLGQKIKQYERWRFRSGDSPNEHM